MDGIARASIIVSMLLAVGLTAGESSFVPAVRLPAVDPGRLGSIERYVEPAEDVLDPVLSFLVGLLRDDVLDTLEGDNIRSVTVRSHRSSLIPLEHLAQMGRGRSDSLGQRVVTFWLDRDSRIPAPYSLLGYHPGSVLVPRYVALAEWRVGRIDITERTRSRTFSLEDCYVWAVVEGAISIDIDGFVDNLLGGAVDDMSVTSLALFTLEGTLYAMAMGYNENGQGRSGALNLVKNELEFPSSWQLKAAGKLLRRKTEGLRAQHHLSGAPTRRTAPVL